MANPNRCIPAVTMLSLACLMFVLPAATAQGQIDHLMPLKHALSAAGAAALTSAQESSINDLITSYRAANAPPAPGGAANTARKAYEDALLAGDKSAAEAQIPAIVSDMMTNTATRLQTTAAFAISVVRVLDSTQLSALALQLGTSGTVRVIEMLAGPGGTGGPGGPGGGPGRGPMGMGRPVN